MSLEVRSRKRALEARVGGAKRDAGSGRGKLEVNSGS
jgi:hypothetical protein